jgi:hypothetical protein
MKTWPLAYGLLLILREPGRACQFALCVASTQHRYPALSRLANTCRTLEPGERGAQWWRQAATPQQLHTNANGPSAESSCELQLHVRVQAHEGLLQP